MTRYFAKALRILVTLVVVCGAVLAGRYLWDLYMNEPWTRDARVRADVVGIAPDVSGLVSEVLVHDNSTVHRGDVLFRVDRQRFAIALQQADAAVTGRKSALDQAERDTQRYNKLGGGIVAQQSIDQAASTAEQASAAYQQALAEQELARLNLARSDVKASVNGTVTNLQLRPGDYVSAGEAVLPLVDSDSLRVEGYFEETKLPRIHIGDAVAIHIMGQPVPLRGRVEGIASAIEDRERTATSSLVANINPTFTWVRLAQRVPVRIRLEDVPPETRLVAGLTATVEVEPKADAEKGPALAAEPGKDASAGQISAETAVAPPVKSACPAMLRDWSLCPPETFMQKVRALIQGVSVHFSASKASVT